MYIRKYGNLDIVISQPEFINAFPKDRFWTAPT